MSHWGVFHDAEYEPHVIPCNDAGDMLPPHECDSACECEPILNTEGGRPFVWVHNDPQRGGSN